MDYFVEIADDPDIEDALGRLSGSPQCPSRLISPQVREDPDTGERFEFPPLSVTHPGVWRIELVSWFHRYPAFAAEVWQTLAVCNSARLRLARVARVLPWVQRPAASNPLLRALNLAPPADAEDFLRALAAATNEDLERARRVLGVDHRGPEFIERLLERSESGPARAANIARLIAHPEEVRDRAAKNKVPVPFSMMLGDELRQIDEYRVGRAVTATASAASDQQLGEGDVGDRTRGSQADAPLREALARNLVGLAFSGGGIRSATFNLGVLQALAKLDVLRHCDYLSTVSGGGYIGSWFTAWTHREGRDSTGKSVPIQEVQDRMRLRLSPMRSPQPLDTRIRPIRYLREFSNYLTPQTGFFSATRGRWWRSTSEICS